VISQALAKNYQPIDFNNFIESSRVNPASIKNPLDFDRYGFYIGIMWQEWEKMGISGA
jgi:hypothetical protein